MAEHQKSFPVSAFLPSEVGDQVPPGRLSKTANRRDDEMRNILIKCGVLEEFDGSAYVEFGKTKLICTVKGPLDLENESASVKAGESLLESVNRAVLQVDFEFSPFCCLESSSCSGGSLKERQSKKRAEESRTEEERHLAVLLKSAFMPVVCLEKYPKSLIELHVSLLQDDGGILPAAVCCATAALCNASVELFDLLVGASLGALDTGGGNPRVLIDPDSAEFEQILRPTVGEKSTHRALISVALMPTLGQVSLFDQQGFSSPELLRVAFEQAQIACRQLYPLLKAKVKMDIPTERQS